MIPYANDAKNEKEIEEIDLSNLYEYEKQEHLHWYDQILLNRPLKVVVVLLLLSVLAPLLIYHFVFVSSMELIPSDGFSAGTCVVPRESRLPCGGGNLSQAECHTQCCYDLNSHVCFHRYPSRFTYITHRIWTEDVVLEPRVATVPFSFQNSLPNIRLTIDEISASHMSLQFYNAREMSLLGRRIEDTNYTYHVTTPETGVTVEAPQGLIFSTIRGPLIASNDIWEIAFKLTNETMYGLGELPLKEGTVKVIYNHKGGLSSIPLIFAKVNSSYHGVLIEAEAPTEVTVLGENQIVVRSITNEGLKLHVFAGPKPSDVMKDAVQLIGADKQLEYWMLGAHICSELSKTSAEAYEELNAFISAASSEGLPFESHCGTAPIVFDSACDLEETYHEDGANAVRAAKKRYVPHVSPYILYYKENETSSEEMATNGTTTDTCLDVITQYEEYMLQTSQSDLYVGSVGGKTVVYPVFENSSAEFMKRLWAYGMEIDGVILENSWPLDDSPKSNESFSFLPYFSQNLELAVEDTPELNVTRPDGTLYFYGHNKYGNHFQQAFKTLLDVDIPMWSTSQWMKGEVNINRQRIDTSWTNLRKELVEAALGGISGHLSWSTPVCGDTENFDPETQTNLCVKWYMAATYMPFIKIHSASIPRTPLAFTGTNKNLMVAALNRRLSLLPYFYTTLQTGPLMRPMFYQFPASEYLKDLNTQYSVGEDLVIVPNLQPSQSHVHFWMPPGSWYELWGGLKIVGDEGDGITMTTTEADLLTFIRGGAVLVVQMLFIHEKEAVEAKNTLRLQKRLLNKDVKPTAEETRLQSNFSLTIALDCDYTNKSDLSADDSDCIAEGSLFMTKNLSIYFKANNEELRITADGDDFEVMCEETAIWAHHIQDINIYGLEGGYNNYDNHRHVSAGIDLCQLRETEVHDLVHNLLG